MGVLAYTVCAGAALACAYLLLRAFARTRTRLLLWSGLCFSFLTVSNLLLSIDLLVFPSVDLFVLRNLTALAGLCLLLYGLIWDAR